MGGVSPALPNEPESADFTFHPMQPEEMCMDSPCTVGRMGESLLYGPEVGLLIASETTDGGILTGNGSLFYLDPVDGALDAAVDNGPVVTPEPASWMLVVTAVIGLAAVVRVRMVRAQTSATKGVNAPWHL